MEEWKEYKLEELSKGKGAYGIGASAVPFSKNKFTYLRITDINDDGTLNKNGLMSVDDEDANKYVLCKNDIVFARTGNSTGRSYFYDGTDGILVYAGFLIKFSLDEKRVNPRILKYYTHSKPYYDWVKSFDTGGTRGNINAKTYGAMPILLPPRNVQDRIVEILKSLDDKIEVNRRINEQLEELAQALFKSWFVDFEPFKDGEFVESELGMIPEGWKVTKLDEVCSYISRGLTPKYDNDSDEIILGQTCVRNNIVTLNNGRKHRPKKKNEKWLQQWDVLINSTGVGSLGRVGIVYFDKDNVAIDSHITVVRPISSLYKHYIGRTLLNKQAEIENMAIGSTGQTELPKDSVKSMLILLPIDDILVLFNKSIEPICKLMYSNLEEITQLSNLRDTLLPKLMSGEIDVNEVEI